MFALYLCAPNDVNGNPKRAWVIFETGGRVSAFVNEGYRGRGALLDALGTVPDGSDLRVKVSAGELRRWRGLVSDVGGVIH